MYICDLYDSEIRYYCQRLINSFIPNNCEFDVSLVDSIPIITCAGRNRDTKVACQIVDKGFCSTKNQYYYGLKLHALVFKRKGRIPFPETILQIEKV